MKQQNNTILISTSYLGPISYYSRILQADSILIENCEHYIKQTYRNRSKILTSNGVQDLIIPVIKVNGNRTSITDVKIANSEKWKINHWRTIETAYNNSAFFLFYEDDIKSLFNLKYDLLYDFNLALLKLILELIGVNRDITATNTYLHTTDENVDDLRHLFNPKQAFYGNFPEYTQVFTEKFDFFPDLSILDLLFNLGPDTKEYLHNLSL